MVFLWFSHGEKPLVFPMGISAFQGHHRLRGGAVCPVPGLHGGAGAVSVTGDVGSSG